MKHSRAFRLAAPAVAVAGVVGLGLGGCTHVHEDAPPPEVAVASVPPTPTPASEPVAPAIPTPSPGATVDAASQRKAEAWLSGAVLPPGSMKVEQPPSGTTIDDESQNWWCAPMAQADGYWTVPGMSLGRAGNWLRAHPSNGLKIIGPGPVPLDPGITNAAVYDFPSAKAFEGMTFDLASWGPHRSVVHVMVGVLAHDSACASAPPGTELGTAGG